MAKKKAGKKSAAKKSAVRDLEAKGRRLKVRGGASKGLALGTPSPQRVVTLG